MKDYFSEVKGYADIKRELNDVVDIINNSEKYKKLGVTTPKGLLLEGNPGVGKTLMAHCFINATKRNTYICKKNLPNDELIKHITDLFNKAKENAPSVILLDDMDKFANEDDFHTDTDAYVTVQSCIDDVKDLEVFVIATINNSRNLPRSLLRAGRFDRKIQVENPEGQDAIDIVEYYLSQKKNVADIDTELIGKIMEGHSCADLETLINEAGIYAGRQEKDKIEMDDVIHACMRVCFNAPESLSKAIEDELDYSAYHEAGHAVIAEVLEPGSVNILSVMKHNGEVGGITSMQRAEKYFMHKSYMETRVMCLLGGKAATEIIFGEVDVGANSDLHRAFSIVERFADDYCSTGFDRWMFSDSASNDLRTRKEMQIYCDMERYYQRAKTILIKNREFLDKLAKALVERKTLTSKELTEIRNGCKIIKE